MAKVFAVFRHELFKQSEPFITEQAEAVPGWSPFYVGRSRAIERNELNSFAMWPDCSMSKVSKGIQAVTRAHKSYLPSMTNAGVRLVHAHFGVEGVYAKGLALSMGVPLVTTFHGYDVTLRRRDLVGSLKPTWINYLLGRQSLGRDGDVFLCVSEHIRQKAAHLGFPEEKLRTHYMGVDLSKFSLTMPTDRSEDYILHVGRLVEKKGAADLVRAFSVIAKKHSSTRLVLVGAGPLQKPIEDLIDSLGLRERVDLLGGVGHERIVGLMEGARLICQPSRTAANGDTEGLPIVLMEAAATGTPVVSTLHAGIPELIEHECSGLLCEEGDVNSLAEMIDAVLDSNTLANRLASAARDRVQREFDVRVQSARLAAMYEELL